MICKSKSIMEIMEA